MEELDSLDQRILTELDKNSRQSYADIGRKLRTNKHTVRNRVNAMVEKGVIVGFRATVNMTKIGYFYYRMHFRLHNTSKKEVNKIVKHLIDDPRVMWLTTSDGKFDLNIVLVAKDPYEFDKSIKDFMEYFGYNIAEMQIVNVLELVFSNRGYWSGKNTPQEDYFVGFQTPGTEKIDEYDNKILRLLSYNCRLSSNEIGKKAGLSADAVAKRIRRMVKKKIISKFFLLIDYEKCGTTLYKTLFYTSVLSDKTLKKIAELAKREQYVFDYVHCIGPWQLELNLEARNHHHYHEIISKFRDTIPEIRYVESLFILDELKFILYPGSGKMD